jgi:pyruvate kinase
MRNPNSRVLTNHQLIADMARQSRIKVGPAEKPSDLLVTMCPSFPHFYKFANDQRVNAVRFNSAMITLPELDNELGILTKRPPKAPVYYDVKGRQMRILKVETIDGNLVLTINHPITVQTPCVVLFKAGADVGMLDHIEEVDGHQRLVFDGGPTYKLVAGESLHIRHESFRNLRGSTKEDNVYTELEQKKIAKVKEAGINKFFLSYVENQYDVDLFREMVGKDAEVWLKIESVAGLNYVNEHFKKEDNLVLVAARGDMFVEVEQPHHIIKGLRDIIKKDPKASVGSRLLLSIVDSPVPSCADLIEIQWLYDIGYRRMMLCDEICLKEHMLNAAVSVFNGIKSDL